MDLEYTFWVMLQLCISPKTAYRHTAYHKQTKNQWARDDPAFVIICCGLVAIASSAYCITFGHGFRRSLLTTLSAVLVDFLLIGAGIATLGWFVANRFLRKRSHSSQGAEQYVEWMYAFDVHCNSYFPLFILLYVLQFFLSPLLLWRNFLSASLSIALYVVAFVYYHYLSFLGYNSLPFLEHTQVFLWPCGALLLMLPFAVLFGFNPTRFTLGIYFN
ncbi:hypothetical protein WJX74_008582 [Apatococcus lobatus]|uniref:Unc-50-like protein n=2 Tax=Apatococcus TaxID=904362 RepID=A0AAW1TCJ2_9CHLO